MKQLSIVLMIIIMLPIIVKSQDDVLPLIYVTRSVSDYSDFDFHLMNPHTGDIMFEVVTPHMDCPISISSNKEWFIYQQAFEQDGNLKINHYLLNLKTGNQTLLKELQDIFYFPNVFWDSDNLSFVFGKGEYKDHTIYRYDIKTETLTELWHTDKESIGLTHYDKDIVFWFQDKRSLTFNNFEEDTYTLNYSVAWLKDSPPNAQYLTLLLNASQNNIFSDNRGYYMIFNIISEEHLTIRDVYRDEKIFELSWRPDSQAVFYLDLDKNFVIYDLVNQQKELLSSSQGLYGLFPIKDMNFYWSPDGRYIVYTIYQGIVSHDNWNRMRLLDTKTGEDILISQYNDPYNQTFVQWIDDTEFIYLNVNHNQSNLFRYDISTQRQFQLTDTSDVIKYKECQLG